MLAWPVAFWGCCDVILALAAVHFGHAMSPAFRAATVSTRYSPWLVACVHAAMVFFASYAVGLYDRRSFASQGRIIWRCILANLVAIALTTLLFQWFPYIQIGRRILLLSFLQITTAMIVLRSVTWKLASQRKTKLLFIGNDAKFSHLRTELLAAHGSFYEVRGHLDFSSVAPGRRLGTLLEACSKDGIDEIVVEEDRDVIDDLLAHSPAIIRQGCIIRPHSAFCEELLGEVPIDSVDHRALLGAGWGMGRQTTELTKRAFDVALALILLLLVSPAMLIAAILVRLTSRGPIIYRQTRVGRFDEPFTILKFRTMGDEAEMDGAVWAVENDVRVTRIGRILRNTRIDELPQLINILKGEMSFAGPRPERPEFVAELEKQIPFYSLRHLVPPGLTGWAQIRYRYGASALDAKRKLSYDLYYVRHYGLWFDLAICLRTLAVVAKGSR